MLPMNKSVFSDNKFKKTASHIPVPLQLFQQRMIVAVLFAAFSFVSAQQGSATDIPPGGTDILPPSAVKKIRCKAAEDPAVAALTVITSDTRFPEAVRISTKIWAKSRWDVGATIAIEKPIQAGDILFFSCYVRGPFSENESGEAAADMVLVKLPTKAGVAPIKKMSITAAQEWTQYFAAFESPDDCDIGRAQLSFALGFRRQDFDIADLRIVNYGKKVKLADMPIMKKGYAGMEADAAWRANALSRIEQIRKGDCTIAITDTAGKPLPNTLVHAALVRHSFWFGGAIRGMAFSPNAKITEQQSERLKQMFIESGFNGAVLPNDLTWMRYPVDGTNYVPAALDWFEKHAIEVRGHTLVWPLWGFMPAAIKQQYENDCRGLQEAICSHIDEYAGRFSGRIAQWIVVNESLPIAHSVLGACGKEAMVDWFKHARKSDPAARLYINDAGIIAGWDENKRSEYIALVEFLIRSGTPLDGIGVQCHFHSFIPPEEIIKRFDHLAVLKKDIQITEFDTGADDETLQGNYTRDFLIAAFSHPAVGGITSWHGGSQWAGVLSGDKRRAMYRDDGSRKPNGDAWTDALKQWHTDLTYKTDVSGTVRLRGFYGTYRLVFKSGAATQTNTISLSSTNRSFSIKFVAK